MVEEACFFVCDIVSSNYYVNGHENMDTIWYMHKFIDRYLLLERRIHHWNQTTTKE